MKRLRAGISRRRAIASIEVGLTGRRGSCGGGRALAIVATDDDQHKQGRVTLVVREALQTAETAFRRGARDAKVKAQVDAILKLCKREPRAKAAVLDLTARHAGLRRSPRVGRWPVRLSPRGEIPPLTPLHRGARNDDDGDGEDEDNYHPNLPRRRQLRRELLARIRALLQIRTS